MDAGISTNLDQLHSTLLTIHTYHTTIIRWAESRQHLHTGGKQFLLRGDNHFLKGFGGGGDIKPMEEGIWCAIKCSLTSTEIIILDKLLRNIILAY